MASINLGNGNVTATETVDNDTITAGNGQDNITVIGNNDTLIVGDGNDKLILTTNPLLGNGTLSTLVAGNGKDTVNVGINLTLVVDGLAGPVSQINPNFTAANGGVPIYDDGSTLPLSLYGQTYSWGPVNMTLGNGTDTVYGDLDTLFLQSFNCDYVFSSTGIENGVITDDTFNFGSSIISLGNGNNDAIYGNLHALTLSAEEGNVGSNHFNGGEIGGVGGGQNIFTFGSNTLSEGAGNNDTIYGNVGDVSLLNYPGGNIGGFGWNGSVAPGGANNFTFGTMVGSNLIGNTIHVGNGNGDSLYGTMHDLNLIAIGSGSIGGDGSPGGDGVDGGSNSFAFGDNTLYAGNGNGDQLYGTLHDIINLGDGAPAAIGGFFGGFESNSFGSNMLVVGNGNNDTLYGSMHDISISASNGSIIGGIGTGHNSFYFDDNTLIAGNGNNDTLYGTLHDISMLSTGHDINEPTHYSEVGGIFGDAGNIIIFGDNTLTAGNGNDMLYGSMHDLQLTQDAEGHIESNTIKFGTNILNAGTGNDTLAGELNNIDFLAIPASITGAASANIDNLANFAANFLAHNKIISGQNTFYLHGGIQGGAGVDTLVFDPAIDIGINIVNHFDSSKDMLNFHNVLPTGTEVKPSLADVENLIASITTDGNTGTLVTFKQVVNDQGPGGTIDFVNNAFHATATDHLLDLVNNQLNHIAILV